MLCLLGVDEGSGCREGSELTFCIIVVGNKNLIVIALLYGGSKSE